MKLQLLVVTLILSLTSLDILAHKKGDWIIRAGAAKVAPQDSSSLWSADSIALTNTGAGVKGDTQLGITNTYMLSDQFGIELLASSPFHHDIQAKGSTLAGLGLSGTVGEVVQLPPTLSLQYYFNQDSNVNFYVGAGINYTLMLEDSLNSNAQAILGSNSIDLDNSTGLALQAGVDYMLNDSFAINASVWKIDIDTTAKVNGTVLGDLEVDVEVDPIVFMLSVAYKL